MNQDMVERYVYAVVRRLPRKQQEDVAQELRGLIDDMLMERCQERLVEEKDLRIVLTELGSPQELYEKYSEDGQKCLIGQPYYSTYKFVMKIVAACVAVGMTISSVILQMMEPQGALTAIGTWLAYLYEGLLGSFGVVTILFAWFYHKNIPLNKGYDFDDLPPVPKKKETVSKWECYAGIGIDVVFAVVFLTVPQVFCSISRDMGVIPIFDTAAVRQTWYFVLLFAVCGIVREIVELAEGRYNKRVLLTKGITNAVSAILSIWWLVGFDLMNPGFLHYIELVFEGEAVFVKNLFANFQQFFLGCILFALVLDTLEGIYRAWKA